MEMNQKEKICKYKKSLKILSVKQIITKINKGCINILPRSLKTKQSGSGCSGKREEKSSIKFLG